MTENRTVGNEASWSQPSMTNRRIERYIRITVTSPQKVGEFLFSHVSYRVNTVTNFSGFEAEHTAVSRRYKDFLRLYKKLVDKYQHEGRIVPPPPEKDFGGMVSVMMTDEDAVVNMDFVQKRMSALQRFLNRLALHPVIREDSLFRDFLQVKAEFQRTLDTDQEERRNSMLSFFSDYTLFRRRMEETNEWFKRKPEMLESFQLQLKKFFLTLKEVIAQRKRLSLATAHMARSVSLLSTYEENSLLAGALVSAASLQEDIQQLYDTQACSEDMLLPELIKDYIYFTDFVQVVFNERAVAYRRLYDAERELERKRTVEFKAREEEAKDTEVAKARRERQQWEEKVHRHIDICNQLSTVLREEVYHYERVRAAEFRTAFFKWARIYVDIQEQMMNNCKEFLSKEEEEPQSSN